MRLVLGCRYFGFRLNNVCHPNMLWKTLNGAKAAKEVSSHLVNLDSVELVLKAQSPLKIWEFSFSSAMQLVWASPALFLSFLKFSFCYALWSIADLVLRDRYLCLCFLKLKKKVKWKAWFVRCSLVETNASIIQWNTKCWFFNFYFFIFLMVFQHPTASTGWSLFNSFVLSTE